MFASGCNDVFVAMLQGGSNVIILFECRSFVADCRSEGSQMVYPQSQALSLASLLLWSQEGLVSRL